MRDVSVRNSQTCVSKASRVLSSRMLRSGVIQGPAYDLRAETCDFFLPDRSWEIAGWARLAKRYGSRVVEWFCGTGELACGLARRGLEVTGVDLMPEMLSVAERRAAGLPVELRPNWQQDDIRDAGLPRRDYDLAIIAMNAFGQMLRSDEQMDALHAVRRHLRPGGALAMALELAGQESKSEQTGIYGPLRSVPTGWILRKVVHARYDADTQVSNFHDHIEVRVGENERYFEYALSLRHFTPDQVFRLLTKAGFAAIGMYGGFDWEPWHDGAAEWIVCAERPFE
jgi:SAM-dependent methyltransferase